MSARDRNEGQALSVRLWMNCLATQEMLCNYLGIRLGLYDALAEGGPATATQLAERANIAPRYAREWIEQQAVSGIVKVDSSSGGPDERVYSLPEGHREVLTESESELSRVAGILPLGAIAHALPRLLEAYRSGEGLSDAAYGSDWRWGHGAANRALYIHHLAKWTRAALTDVHAKLSADGGRVADVACGAGWAAIALARAYPKVRVDGFDIDADLAADANSHVQGAGLADRVRIEVRDGTELDVGPRYDLVCLFDTLHEVPNPVEMLRRCGAICRAGAPVWVMDAKVADAFTAPAGEIERFQYTTSVLHCLPACLSEQPSAETGTVIRASLVSRYARAAGFARVEALTIEERFHRFYRLQQ